MNTSEKLAAEHSAKDYLSKDIQRFWRQQRFSKKVPAVDRFNDLYLPDPNSGCWLWIGTVMRVRPWSAPLHQLFRPVFDRFGQRTFAYRFAYETFVGPIPDGKFICHKCNVPLCVNPNHLYAGDTQTNADDRVRAGRNQRHMALRTHCPKGHEYNKENTRILREKYRACRACERQFRKNWVAKVKASKASKVTA